MMFIEQLAEKANESKYFIELFNKLELLTFYNFTNSQKQQQYKFSNKELNDLLRFADIFASSENSNFRNYANRIVSNLYNFYKDNDIYNSYAKTIYTKMGLFPTVDIISNSNKKEILVPNDIQMLDVYKKIIQHDSELGVYYTDKQYEVVNNLKQKNNFSLSAPTSFGKTMIITNFINDVVKSKKNCHICILVPTNALLKEVSTEMKSKYENKNNNIKVITYPEIKTKDLQFDNLIFVFTPERLVNYFAKNNLDIEYLFVDEAQKILKKNDDRSPVFYNAISYASYRGTKLYFLSPNIDNPDVFLTLANRDGVNTCKITDKLVIQNRYLFDYETKIVKYLDFKNDIIEEKVLNANITTLPQAIKDVYKNYLNQTSTIVYYSSKAKMTDDMLEYIKDENPTKNEELKSLVKVVKETIHEKYFLVNALEKGIAYHYGQMPKAIREKIEDLFKRKVIKILFTTSTLLEGVNIQAKNIILTSDNNGLSDLTEEDFLNLIGRAGRFKSELYGNVVCLKGKFEKSYRYKYFASQNVSNLSSEILDSVKGNFYKDIKQIIHRKPPITKNLYEDHTKCLIRQQYANITVLHNKLGFDSKLKSNLVNVNKDPAIFKNLEKNEKSVSKLKNFKEYTSIPLEYQQYIFEKQDLYILSCFKQFDISKLNNQTIKDLTEKIMKEYDFYERGLIEYENGYLYYGNLLVSWINGKPLNVIIKNIIDNIANGKIKFLLDKEFINGKKIYKDYVGSDKQINLIINDIFEKIENDIKHMIKIYFSNYIYLNTENKNMDKSMEKLVDYIEFGTTNNDIIELQKFGFSRELSLYILERHNNCLVFNDLELENIDMNKLFQEFDKEDVLFEELKEYEYLVD